MFLAAPLAIFGQQVARVSEAAGLVTMMSLCEQWSDLGKSIPGLDRLRLGIENPSSHLPRAVARLLCLSPTILCSSARLLRPAAS